MIGVTHTAYTAQCISVYTCMYLERIWSSDHIENHHWSQKVENLYLRPWTDCLHLYWMEQRSRTCCEVLLFLSSESQSALWTCTEPCEDMYPLLCALRAAHRPLFFVKANQKACHSSLLFYSRFYPLYLSFPFSREICVSAVSALHLLQSFIQQSSPLFSCLSLSFSLLHIDFF